MAASQAELSVRAMAGSLGVSRSGYYAWRARGAGRRARADERLQVEIAAAHAASRGTYGAPRIRAELAARGIRTSRKRVGRLMRALGIRGVSRRRRVRTRIRDGEARPAPDLVDWNFVATALSRSRLPAGGRRARTGWAVALDSAVRFRGAPPHRGCRSGDRRSKPCGP